MATPREITYEEYGRIYDRLQNKAVECAVTDNRPGDLVYWFSSRFQPCSVKVRTILWRYRMPRILNHYTSIPCDKYCSKKMPVATCLIQTHDGKYYTCRHKVGNCPWKK